MKELMQIRTAVINALNQAGLTAIEAFPDARAKAYSNAVAAVAVGAADGRSMSLCNYLGETYDQQAGTVRELYGRQLEGEIIVDVRGNRAAVCEAGCQLAADVLLSGLPVGIRPGELRWEALHWEKDTAMFLRRGAFRCQAIFVAAAEEDESEFLDFNLRGVMQS